MSLLLSICSGSSTAFDIPARQAFLIQMVEGREDLTNAIGSNSSMFFSHAWSGPAIAGFLIAAAGEGVCFFLEKERRQREVHRVSRRRA